MQRIVFPYNFLSIKTFPFYEQADSMDCGASCLRMVMAYHSRHVPMEEVRQAVNTSKDGTSLYHISEAAEAFGFHTLAAEMSYEELQTVAPLPAIVHWEGNHFVVVYKISHSHVWIADPARTNLRIKKETFEDGWSPSGGRTLLLEPLPDYVYSGEMPQNDWQVFQPYLSRYRQLGWQLLLGFVLSCMLSVSIALLVQALIDDALLLRNAHTFRIIWLSIALLLFAFFSANQIRQWVLQYIGQQLQHQLHASYLMQLFRLPATFMEKRHNRDVIHRMEDIDALTKAWIRSIPNVVYVFAQWLAFAVICSYYDWRLLGIFLLGSALALVCDRYVLLNAKRHFAMERPNEGGVIQQRDFVESHVDLRLYEAAAKYRRRWEAARLQTSQGYQTYQRYFHAVHSVVLIIRDMALLYWMGVAVVQGSHTTGMMAALLWLIAFGSDTSNTWWKFGISTLHMQVGMERLREVLSIHQDKPNAITDIPSKGSFVIQGVHYQDMLHGLDATLPFGKLSVIVGATTSGKSNLIKLLTGLAAPDSGLVLLGDYPIKQFDSKAWHKQVRAILPESDLLDVSIAENVALGKEHIQSDQLRLALQAVGMWDVISQLPQGVQTMISDWSLSYAQRERILLARVFYAPAPYVIIDGATQTFTLAEEKALWESFSTHLPDCTIIWVPHSANMAQYADYVLALEKGRAVFEGVPLD